MDANNLKILCKLESCTIQEYQDLTRHKTILEDTEIGGTRHLFQYYQ